MGDQAILGIQIVERGGQMVGSEYTRKTVGGAGEERLFSPQFFSSLIFLPRSTI